ncbi:MAG: hypothetical protein DRO87_11270 [Candidatus Thorarchaeota archaeon]|nr:MAG: hypothetical protein DRO87_11270 [Candidatus Thorarchaeota archaeon]
MSTIKNRLNKLENKQGGGLEYVKIKDIPGQPKKWEYKGKEITEAEYFRLIGQIPGLRTYMLYRSGGEKPEAYHPDIEPCDDSQVVFYIPDNERD